MKELINGVILIISCHKHKETRLKEFGLLNEDKLNKIGWKVHRILGNPLQNEEYCFENGSDINSAKNILIKCEDSYIHILKKLIISIKIMYELYDIKEGILRCGDDLVFNEEQLISFLQSDDKKDYMGELHVRNESMGKTNDNFMLNYFRSHPHDFLNPLNGIFLSDNFDRLNEVPSVNYHVGVVVYLSNKSNLALMNEKGILIDNYYKNDYGYPYIIEDIGVGYILYNAGIFPYHYSLYTENCYNFKNYVALHTNKYK